MKHRTDDFIKLSTIFILDMLLGDERFWNKNLPRTHTALSVSRISGYSYVQTQYDLIKCIDDGLVEKHTYKYRQNVNTTSYSVTAKGYALLTENMGNIADIKKQILENKRARLKLENIIK